MKWFYRWTRDLHMYAGLFASPLVLVFSVSTLLLNHPGTMADRPGARPEGKAETFRIDVPGGAGTLEQARAILRQVKVTGEIDYLSHSVGEMRLVIPVMKPGEVTRVEVDLRASTATVSRHPQGLASALVYLHRMPGPHNAKFRGNWLFTTWWTALADGFVYTVMFLTLSGLYLWWKLKSERVIGWLLLATGALSVLLLVIGLSPP